MQWRRLRDAFKETEQVEAHVIWMTTGPGKVLVVACEPAEVDDMGLELSPAVDAAADRAVALVLETVDEMRTATVQSADRPPGPHGG